MTALLSSAPRCLVLGGSGFIGSHLIDALVQRGLPVRSFDRRPSGHADASSVESMVGEFTDAAAVARALRGCEVVFHLVSTTLPKTSNDNPARDVEENLVGTLALLDAARKEGIAKVIFVSSGGTVYGVPRWLPITEDHPTLPLSSYGIVKLTIERYLHLHQVLHGLNYQVLRLSNPFGERQAIHGAQGAIAVFMGQALRGETLEIWGDGSVVRDYIYIADVIEALLLALPYGGSERILNIGSGQGQSVNQIIAAIGASTGIEVKTRYQAQRAFDVPASVLSIERAKAELGWQPRTSFADGLARTGAWIRRELAGE